MLIFLINHPFYSKLYSIFESFCLSQIVTEHTHLGPNGTTSMIDLIATSSPSLLQSCETTPPLANSDHMGLLLQSQWRQTRLPRGGSTRYIWSYKHPDWHKAHKLIEDSNWDFLVDDVDISWENWKKHFLEIMAECIPQRPLSNRRNLPWLSVSLVQLMTRRNMLFSQAKRSGKRSDVEKYEHIRNRVVTQLLRAKSIFLKNLNPRSNSKKFWSAVKHLKKKHNSILVLKHGSVTANTNQEKAEMLNSFCSTCFNSAFPPLSPSNVHTQPPVKFPSLMMY